MAMAVNLFINQLVSHHLSHHLGEQWGPQGIEADRELLGVNDIMLNN